MQILRRMEIGVMFWPAGDALATVRAQKEFGVRCGQLAIPGDADLKGWASDWKKALADEDFTLVTLFATFKGEDYADIPTVQRTVGFIPPATRAEREARILEISDLAAQLGVPSIATHVGCVPDSSRDGDYMAVRDMVRRVCDHAAKHGQTFALETGQEGADTLLDFFIEVNRENLRINFDPANMVLYGSGDPIHALSVLQAHVVTVHCKDGDWPPKGVPGALGTERPLGQGAVGMERFIAKLKQIHYAGPLCIEREIPDQAERARDVRMAVGLLQKLVG
jgi:sugar phosphate isomerase/epimerase